LVGWEAVVVEEKVMAEAAAGQEHHADTRA
jgi:hypothetical protein